LKNSAGPFIVQPGPAQPSQFPDPTWPSLSTYCIYVASGVVEGESHSPKYFWEGTPFPQTTSGQW